MDEHDTGQKTTAHKTTVLYIAGSGRSGSTVLANILGEVDGFFSGGEVRFLWDRGLAQDRLCGCGASFRQCPVWTEVLRHGFGGAEQIDDKRITAQLARGTRVRHVPKILRGPHDTGWVNEVMPDVLSHLGTLYSSIAETTGSDVIVDSSKLPAYAFVLGAVPTIELVLVHLVRDPRAAAYSWQRKKALPDLGPHGIMQQQTALKSTLLWDVWNATARRLGADGSVPYLRLRYEDFVDRPKATIQSLLDLVARTRPDRAARALPFLDDHTVSLGVSHTVAGNPNRLERGPVTLRSDSEWIGKLSTGSRVVSSSAAAPLLGSFGYALRPPRR